MLCLTLAALGPGCREATTPSPGKATISGVHVLDSLLAREDLREIQHQDPELPVTIDLLEPRASGRVEHGSYPALIGRPPFEVRYEVPALAGAVHLRLGTAVARDGYLSQGQVIFEVLLDGERVVREVHPTDPDVPQEARAWREHEIPVPKGGALVLRASYAGGGPAPRAGFGRLQLVLPYERPRTVASPERPNVVLVVIDTLRADRLSCYGNESPVSPTMDLLARRGVRFVNAFASSAWTIPSTASILTGLSVPEHGLGYTASFSLAEGLVTLAEAFQEAGFTTAAFAANPLISASRSFDQGFEHFMDYRWERSGKVLDDVLPWLDEHAQHRFFLYIHFIDPHYPYEAEEALTERFAPPEPEGFIAEELGTWLRRSHAGEPGVERGLIELSARHQLALYDAEVASVDRSMTRLLNMLSKRGLGDRTILAVTSDHGEEFLEHGWVGHNEQLYDETVRVPLILAGPGVPAGVSTAQPVENRWLAPTLLELASVEPTGNLVGPNLLHPPDLAALVDQPVLMTTNKGTWVDRETGEMIPLGQIYSVLYKDYRLIWSPQAGEERDRDVLRLYHLKTDPDALHDMSAEYPEMVEHMRNLLGVWIEGSKKTRPRFLVPPADATIELLRDLGYLGDE